MNNKRKEALKKARVWLNETVKSHKKEGWKITARSLTEVRLTKNRQTKLVGYEKIADDDTLYVRCYESEPSGLIRAKKYLIIRDDKLIIENNPRFL